MSNRSFVSSEIVTLMSLSYHPRIIQALENCQRLKKKEKNRVDLGDPRLPPRMLLTRGEKIGNASLARIGGGDSIRRRETGCPYPEKKRAERNQAKCACSSQE